MCWEARGTLEATSHSELLAFTCDSFEKVLTHHSEVADFVRHYCIEMCTAAASPEYDGMTDLSVDIDFDTIIVLMPSKVRQSVSRMALEQSQQEKWKLKNLVQVAKAGKEALDKEIRDCKCHLTYSTDGTQQMILRVVHVVVARILRGEGLLCVRLAKWSNGKGVACFALPGEKVRGGESPSDTLDRILRERFETFIPNLNLDLNEVFVEQRPSPSFGVDTKYIRRVYNYSLSGVGDDLPWDAQAGPGLRHRLPSPSPPLAEMRSPQRFGFGDASPHFFGFRTPGFSSSEACSSEASGEQGPNWQMFALPCSKACSPTDEASNDVGSPKQWHPRGEGMIGMLSKATPMSHVASMASAHSTSASHLVGLRSSNKESIICPAIEIEPPDQEDTIAIYAWVPAEEYAQMSGDERMSNLTVTKWLRSMTEEAVQALLARGLSQFGGDSSQGDRPSSQDGPDVPSVPPIDDRIQEEYRIDRV